MIPHFIHYIFKNAKADSPALNGCQVFNQHAITGTCPKILYYILTKKNKKSLSHEEEFFKSSMFYYTSFSKNVLLRLYLMVWTARTNVKVEI